MENKKLYRSASEKMIGGVCGGLAEYFNIDPTIVRLVFVLLLLTGSAGFWIYVVLLVIMPLEPIASETVIDASAKETTEEQE